MNKPNDVLLGLTRYMHPMVLFFLLISVSHLLLPLLASMNPNSLLWERSSNPLSFLSDWEYHLFWLGIIAPSIMLIYTFHKRAKKFVQTFLGDYETSYVKFSTRLYVPLLSLAAVGVISYLIYRVNGASYEKVGMSTWLLPEPIDGLVPSTVVFYIWSTIIGSIALVYIAHHVYISICVKRLLASWTDDDIEKMKGTQLLKKLNAMVEYFTFPVYVLVPGFFLGGISILMRMIRLNVKLNEPNVIIVVVLMSIGLFALYIVPVALSGLVSRIRFVKLVRDDVRRSGLSMFPTQRGFWVAILSPAWSIIATTILELFTKPS